MSHRLSCAVLLAASTLAARTPASAASFCIGHITALASGSDSASGEDDDLAVILDGGCGCASNRFVQPASTPNHRGTVAGALLALAGGKTVSILFDGGTPCRLHNMTINQ
jgi:hypothetical protein